MCQFQFGFIEEKQTDRSKVESIYIDTLHNSYLGVFNVHNSRSEYFYVLKEFDETGNEINSISIQPSENKKLNTGKLITINENERLLIGTYDFVKGGSIDKKDYFSNEAIGFYSIRIIDNQQAVFGRSDVRRRVTVMIAYVSSVVRRGRHDLCG